jgi:hypothetical protein
MATQKIGDLSIPVGHYDDPVKKDNVTGKPLKRFRYRRIGTLMRTTHSDNSGQFWVKINGEALADGLLVLALRAKGKAGDDAVIATVFEDRDAGPPPAGATPGADPEPELDEDGGPF